MNTNSINDTEFINILVTSFQRDGYKIKNFEKIVVEPRGNNFTQFEIFTNRDENIIFIPESIIYHNDEGAAQILIKNRRINGNDISVFNINVNHLSSGFFPERGFFNWFAWTTLNLSPGTYIQFVGFRIEIELE